MAFVEILLLLIFSLLLLLIFLYSLSQLHLLISYLKNRKKEERQNTIPPFLKGSSLPKVTIQLPLYNEKEVVERLLQNISKIDYPRQELEIQVLDDSTDESASLTENLVKQLQEEGLNIRYLPRSHRKDYKAGALREGLKSARGEFIAVFDSDFLPQSDWLWLTLPYFDDNRIGAVQTRWGHLNRNYSLLTKIQAFALDFHFLLEQNGRNFSGYFINFNGTAGIWRKECILHSGNWEGDTLTEDLDLSYRAQLGNWKFKYLGNIETPAELPITMEAVRSQQFRWNKGAAQNFRKNFKKVLNTKSLSKITKFHCFFHLLNSSLFLLVLILALLSVPVLFLTQRPEYSLIFRLMLIFTSSTLIFFASYWITYSRLQGRGFRDFISFLGLFFSFFSIAMGFSLHNSRAVIQGHLGKKSEFIRTPKFNISETHLLQVQHKPKITFQLFLEIFLLLYFIFAVASAFFLGNYSLLLFHLMLLFGFGYVVINSILNLSPE